MAHLICDHVKVMNYSMGRRLSTGWIWLDGNSPKVGISFNDLIPYPINYVPA